MISSSWGVGLVAIAVPVIAGVMFFKKRKWMPRGYKPFTPTTVTGRDVDNTRDIYKLRKVPENVDHIVIGSGMGGLTTAGCLAKVGRKVLVLEQHYVTGGCTHCFDDKNFEFDTGVHYVGDVKMLVDVISGEKKTEWAQTGTAEDGYVYDVLKVGGTKPHGLRKGQENFLADLIERFPNEEAAIRGWLKHVKKSAKSSEIFFISKMMPQWVASIFNKFLGSTFARYAAMTPNDVLDGLTQNKELRALLTAQYGDLGMTPSTASFAAHAGIVKHYLHNGGYYPVGGPQEVSRNIIPLIESAGGRVLVRARVAKILCRDTVAIGVEMENGDQIFARRSVISSISAKATYNQLLPKEVVQKVGRPDGLDALKGSVAHMYAFVGLEGSSAELNLPSHNVWSLPCGADNDTEAATAKYYSDPYGQEELMMFLGFPSAKDPSWEEKNPGRSTCVVITEAWTEWFEKFGDEPQGKRGEEYEALKLKFQEKLLAGMYKHFPQTKGKVVYVEMASPVSNTFYLGQPYSYGLEHSPARFKAEGLRAPTAIKNLFLSGQDIITNGFAGALFSGFITAHAVLGYGVLDVLRGRTLIEDLFNLDEAQKKGK